MCVVQCTKTGLRVVQLITKSQPWSVRTRGFKLTEAVKQLLLLLQAKEAVMAMLLLAQQAGLQVLQGEHLTALTVPATDQVTHLLTLTCLWPSCFIMLCHFIVCHFISCHMRHVPNVCPYCAIVPQLACATTCQLCCHVYSSPVHVLTCILDHP